MIGVPGEVEVEPVAPGIDGDWGTGAIGAAARDNTCDGQPKVRGVSSATWRRHSYARASTMASSGESDLCISTSMLMGGDKLAVKMSICWHSEMFSQRARSLRKCSWYSSTEPVRRRCVSSLSGLLHTRGSKRLLMPSTNAGHSGTLRFFSRR